jgi:hypothetical protein
VKNDPDTNGAASADSRFANPAAPDSFDARLGKLMPEVYVPPDLEMRLFDKLQLRDIPPSAAASDLQRPVGPSVPSISRTSPAVFRLTRRRSFAAAAAGLCLAAGSVWFVNSRQPTVDLDDLVGQVIADDTTLDLLAPATSTAEDEQHVLPETMNTRVLVGPPRLFGDHQPRIHIYIFTMRRNGRLVEGRLLAVPVAILRNPPIVSGFLTQPAAYREHGFCSSAWVEGRYAYVCLVRGSEHDLRSLVLTRQAG